MSNNLLLANLNQPDALEAAYHQSPQKFEAQFIFSISGKKRIAEATLSDYINVSLISATLLYQFI